MAAPNLSPAEIARLTAAYEGLARAAQAAQKVSQFESAVAGMRSLREAVTGATAGLSRTDRIDVLRLRVLELQRAMQAAQQQMAATSSPHGVVEWVAAIGKLNPELDRATAKLQKLQAAGARGPSTLAPALADLSVAGAQGGAGGGSGGGAGGGAAGAAAAAAGGALALAGAALGAAAAVAGLAQQAAQYVQYANPAAAQRLQMAFQDLYAAVGVGLTPVVTAFTQVLDFANAAITQFQPVITTITGVLSGVFLDVAKEVITLAMSLAEMAIPSVVTLAAVFQQLWAAGKPLAAALVDLVGQLAKMQLDTFADLFGSVLVPAITLFADHLGGAAKGLAAVGAVIGELIDSIRNRHMPDFEAAIRRATTATTRPAAGPITHAARPAAFVDTEEIGRQARLAAYGSRSVQEEQLAAQLAGNGYLARLVAAARPAGTPQPAVDPAG
jgi:hypothetical protein